MSTIQTCFRTVVMLATLGLLAKAWYHYGPTVDELHDMGTRVSEIAQEAWADYWQSPLPNSSLAGNPIQSPPQLQPGPATFIPPSVEPPPIHAVPASPSAPGPIQLAGGALPSAAPPALVPLDAPIADPRLGPLYERLTSFGVRDQQLEPWGNSGRLFRFSCSAPWVQSPSFSRHFEAVAETPDAAVEKVVAEIDAWQSAQR